MTRRVVLDVEGMQCDDCVQAVADALASLPGVTVATVEIGRAEVLIEDGAYSLGDLLDAVADAGYAADEHPPELSP